MNRCASVHEEELLFKKKKSVCYVVYLSSSSSTVSFNYANKLICAGGTLQALQSCLRLRADRALRHNTLLQRGKHVRLVNYLQQTNWYTHRHTHTDVDVSLSNSHPFNCTQRATLKWGNEKSNISNNVQHLQIRFQRRQKV